MYYALPNPNVSEYIILFLSILGETEGLIVTRKQGESQYGDNYKCKWLIDAGENMRLKLTVLSTDLEWAPTYTTCSGYDNLQIIEGNILTHFRQGNSRKGNLQTEQTQIRCHRMWHLIRVYTVCIR